MWDILIAVDLFRPAGFLFLFNHAKEEDWDFTFHIMMFLLSCLVVSFQESLLEPGTWGRVGGGRGVYRGWMIRGEGWGEVKERWSEVSW